MPACVSSDGAQGRVPPACSSCDPLTSRCTRCTATNCAKRAAGLP